METTEILPEVRTWTGIHPNLREEVRSYWVPAAGAVIDPLLAADEDIEAFRSDPPEYVLLTNRHHLRSSERFAAELGSTVRCHRAGLHEFEGGPKVEGFEFGDEVAPGIEALEVGAICDEETGLLVREARALSVADAVINVDGALGFFPDPCPGDDPEAVRRAIRASYARLLDRDFEHLLVAHGDPVIGTGKEALREFCEAG
jgi:glyoxylase-like metal-dependent hydrolase (beta-lactamase superfamily II)